MKYRIIDSHCDTASLFRPDSSGYCFCHNNEFGHVDLPRLEAGGVKLQFFALFIKEEHKDDGALRYCLRLLDNFHCLTSGCSDQLQLILCRNDLGALFSDSKLGALLSVEGGEALEGEIEVLRALYRLGIRSLGLTWNFRNSLASGVGENLPGQGLTPFGIEVIKEMNKLGMIIDLAHINETGFSEALAESIDPVIVSHANSRTICDHPRNLSDWQLKMLQQNNGVIGLCYYPDFIALQDPKMENLLDHFVHIASLIGTEHIGLGSDFDGIDRVLPGLEDAAAVPLLLEGLSRRGFSDSEIERIAFKNYLRILQAVLP